MNGVKNYELAEKDYIAGMKYKDIAKKYGVSMNTVKSWKKKVCMDKGKKGRTQKQRRKDRKKEKR